MTKERILLPSNGLLGYDSHVVVSAMRGRHLSTILSSLDSGAIDLVITDIIEPKIDIDLLTDEDKTVILYKSRELTFGSEIKLRQKCPICGKTHDYVIDYSDFSIKYLEKEDVGRVHQFELQDGTRYEIENQVPTGKTWEEIEQYKRRYEPPLTLSYILLQVANIGKVNGREITVRDKVNLLADILPANVLVDVIDKMGVKYGLDPTYTLECLETGTAFTGALALTADIFR